MGLGTRAGLQLGVGLGLKFVGACLGVEMGVDEGVVDWEGAGVCVGTWEGIEWCVGFCKAVDGDGCSWTGGVGLVGGCSVANEHI